MRLVYETMDGIGHCGIYIGDGNFIHASSGSGYCVKISTLLSEMRSEIVNWDNIAEYIINMPYDSFLLTDYWLIISYYLKNKYNFTCTNCGRHFNLASCLNVHHKTYENHGYEHLQSVMDNDLEVLCEDCHKRKHSEHAHQEE